jgi:hypothetical protein
VIGRLLPVPARTSGLGRSVDAPFARPAAEIRLVIVRRAALISVLGIAGTRTGGSVAPATNAATM